MSILLQIKTIIKINYFLLIANIIPGKQIIILNAKKRTCKNVLIRFSNNDELKIKLFSIRLKRIFRSILKRQSSFIRVELPNLHKLIFKELLILRIKFFKNRAKIDNIKCIFAIIFWQSNFTDPFV